jgi:hypothetical protein
MASLGLFGLLGLGAALLLPARAKQQPTTT